MNIILIDTQKYDYDYIREIADYLNKIDPEKWLILPKDMDLLLDCTTEQLYNIKKYIEDSIRKKEIINEM